MSEKDEHGNTALIAACFHRPPVRAIRAMLHAASASPGKPMQIHLDRAGDGSTALQVACACGASLKVVKSLLEAPSGLVDGGTLVSCSDFQGSTPLSDLVVQYTLECKSPQHRSSLPLEQVHLVDVEVSPLFDAFWCKVDSLIRAAWLANEFTHSEAGNTAISSAKSWRGSSFISMVHGAAYVAESCPETLIDLICRCYPHMISFGDSRGMLPLHVVLMPGSRKSQSAPTAVLARRRATFIARLLDMWPAAARIPVPVNMRTPFCQAIASGLHWNLPDGADGPLKMLWNVTPECLQTPDPLSGQLPFVVAAEVSQGSSVAEAQLQISTIYSLIRLAPSLLR